MSTADAYLLFYKGVQLGDELFEQSPSIPFSAPQVQRLFRSPIAAINQTRTGRVFMHKMTVHLIKQDAVEVADQIEQWASLISGETGDVEVYQDLSAPTLIRTISDALMVSIEPAIPRSPARARIAPVRFQFITTTATA